MRRNRSDADDPAVRRLRRAQRIGLVLGALAGIVTLIGSDSAGFVVVTTPAAVVFGGWLDWRSGASWRQVLATGLLSYLAVNVGFLAAFVSWSSSSAGPVSVPHDET